MLTIWQLLQAILLVTNGVAVLNEDRFLPRVGLGMAPPQDSYSMERRSDALAQVAGFINATQYLRLPLIGVNLLVVLVKLLLG